MTTISSSAVFNAFSIIPAAIGLPVKINFQSSFSEKSATDEVKSDSVIDDLNQASLTNINSFNDNNLNFNDTTVENNHSFNELIIKKNSMQAQPVEVLDYLNKCFKESDINVRELVPRLVAHKILDASEMMRIYDQNSEAEKLNTFLKILSTKLNWLAPLINALLNAGKTTIVEMILQHNTKHND